ncbi:hypothetical protein N0V90_003158 [Kalmusia sp. IMI 367209]|nr:hypothetical protein N0V90_003158 [Kalmusia sp. IMI 367209]
MPLVIALPHQRAASSRRSLSRRPVRHRAPSSSSRISRTTSASTVSISPTRTISISPSRGERGDTNVEIQFRRHITVNNSTGAEHYSTFTDEEDSSGVQVSSGSQGEYTESEEDEDDEWDYIDEIEPSDSASRPARVKHHAVQAPAPPSRPQGARRKSARHTPVHEDPRHRSRSRHDLEHDPRPRRRRPQSVHSESLDSHDDYPYGPPRPGPSPHHPHDQWAHVPQQAPPSGYAPSMMSDPRYNPFQGGPGAPGAPPPPPDQLVPFGREQYAFNQNPFAPGGANPFASPHAAGGPNGYFEGHGLGHGGRRGHRNSMPPPSNEMMPYYPNGGYYPPYGMPPYGPPGMPGMHGMYPPYPPPHQHTPPPHHSKKSTPAPRDDPLPPPPPALYAPPPPDTAKEDGVLSKLEMLLLGKAEMEEKKAEDAKFSRLEQLLIEQQQARIDKEAAKRKAAEEAAIKAAHAKLKGDEDKLEKLEQLILAQKEEQIKREAAVEAARAADKAEADAKVAKEAAEKAAQAEAAAKLLEAAKAAREEAEAKAAKEAEDTKAAHEKALAEAKAAQEELEKAKKAAEEEAAKLKPSDAPKPPIKFKDAVGRKFSFPWHLCKTWKGMEELIKQAFLHVDVIGPHVHEGHYDLVGPDGEIILPQVWETMVQPDWAITMHMWPMPEPPPPPPKPEDLPPPPPPGPFPKVKSRNKSKKLLDVEWDRAEDENVRVVKGTGDTIGTSVSRVPFASLNLWFGPSICRVIALDVSALVSLRVILMFSCKD